MKILNKIILFVFVLSITALVSGQEWEVPDDKAARLSPFEFTEAIISEGSDIYSRNCLSCHGTPGKANFQRLSPLPGDPADDKIQANSDGSLYYKISGGKGLMPSFSAILTPEEIWKVISYIRSFNNSYIQTVEEIQILKDLKWSFIKILLSHNNDTRKIEARVIGLEDNEWTPVGGIELSLSAERIFGRLAIAEPGFTDEAGIVKFSYPDDLPGNKEGEVSLVAMLSDQETFGRITADTVLSIGLRNNAPPLNQERAMWNINRKAPIWVLVSYTSAVILVWAFIILVLLRLRKIYLIGDNKLQENENH